MGLMSIINIDDYRKERKAVKIVQKATVENDSGFSVYESLEFVKGNLREKSLGLQLDMIRNILR